MRVVQPRQFREIAKGMSIRPAVAADIPDLLDIERVFPTDGMSGPDFKKCMARPAVRMLLARSTDSTLGYALGIVNARISSIRIFSLAVRPGSQGAGIGTVLLAALEHEAERLGMARMHLEVRRDNPAAQRFYFKHGFERFGEYRDFYADRASAWRLRKKLESLGSATP